MLPGASSQVILLIKEISFSLFFFLVSGIAASFAVKLFKAWMAEKDANSVTSSLRKANLDKRLLVSVRAEGVMCFMLLSWFCECLLRVAHD